MLKRFIRRNAAFAAAFALGPTLELVNRYSPEMNFLGLTDLHGLSLTEVQVLPIPAGSFPGSMGLKKPAAPMRRNTVSG